MVDAWAFLDDWFYHLNGTTWSVHSALFMFFGRISIDWPGSGLTRNLLNDMQVLGLATVVLI